MSAADGGFCRIDICDSGPGGRLARVRLQGGHPLIHLLLRWEKELSPSIALPILCWLASRFSLPTTPLVAAPEFLPNDVQPVFGH